MDDETRRSRIPNCWCSAGQPRGLLFDTLHRGSRRLIASQSRRHRVSGQRTRMTFRHQNIAPFIACRRLDSFVDFRDALDCSLNHRSLLLVYWKLVFHSVAFPRRHVAFRLVQHQPNASHMYLFAPRDDVNSTSSRSFVFHPC